MSRPCFSPEIDQELNDAISRLIDKGRDVNFASVAREAGRSRSLLSSHTTHYREARARILAIRSSRQRKGQNVPSRPPVPSDRELIELRAEVGRLQAEAVAIRSALVATVAANSASLDFTADRQQADLQRRRAAQEKRRAAAAIS